MSNIGSVSGSSLGEEGVGKVNSSQWLTKEPGTSGDFGAVIGVGRVLEVGEASLNFSFVGVGGEVEGRDSLEVGEDFGFGFVEGNAKWFTKVSEAVEAELKVTRVEKDGGVVNV